MDLLELSFHQNTMSLDELFNEVLEQRSNLSFEPIKAKAVVKLTLEEKLSLVKSNLNLIDKCLATKRMDILCAYELRKYGVLALRTAALDYENQGNFQDFASSRIESLMNRAIAEAHILLAFSNQIIEEDQIHKEFASIHNRFSTLLF